MRWTTYKIHITNCEVLGTRIFKRRDTIISCLNYDQELINRMTNGGVELPTS